MVKKDLSERMARGARQLEATNGILSLLPPRKGKLVPIETTQLVIDFYQHDENSRIMPGMKD